MTNKSASLLPDAVRMGAVHLNVRDVESMTDFYVRTLGMQVLGGGEGVMLGTDEPLLVLHPTPDAPPREPGSAGLFHVAILLPARSDLAHVLRHLVAQRTPLEGASDHAVSEALYLADPEGNGLEIYVDRPRDKWRVRPDGGVEMVTNPLDVQDLLAQATDVWRGMPPDTRVGHVHLQVGDVPSAEAFYRDVVGFALTARYGAQASFYAAGGYHHHVATNVWGVAPGARAEPTRLGLRQYTLHVGDEAALDALESRLQKAGVPARRGEDGAVVTRDPSGNELQARA